MEGRTDSARTRPPIVIIIIIVVVIMHHYRPREDETSCSAGGSDPYFYLRLSAGGPASYQVPPSIKLEVDVKPEPRIMTPVGCLQHHQLQQPDSTPSDMTIMDTSVICKDEGGTTEGIGLMALTHLDGYGGLYKSSYGGDEDCVISSTADLQRDRIDDSDKADKMYSSYGRLVYSSPDDIKHQVRLQFFSPS